MQIETRQKLESLKRQIGQLFIDAASYNDNYLPEGETPIVADPDGELQRLLELIERDLEKAENGQS